jgi:hypothetical protein
MKNSNKASSVQIAQLDVKLAQKAIERRARELIEAAPDAIVVVDQAGRIVLVNAQTEELFGYRREELLGQMIEMLVPESARREHVAKRDQFIAQPSVRPMGTGLDLAGQRKDGSRVPIEISLSPLHTDIGVLVSAAIRDITERREAQQALHEARAELELRVRERTAELEQANAALQVEVADRHAAEHALHQAQKMEAVGQLTGGVAHDFNNLLTVVMGNLQLLARRIQGDPLADELIKSALKAAKRGADLNRTLLAFSRRQRLAPVPVDFNEMIAGMASLLRRSLGEQVNIVVAEAAHLPRAMADVTQLESALLNLAVNSRDAMPLGGTLTIETAAVQLDEHYAALEADVNPGPYVMLAVSDTGTGMPQDVAARAFEPFFTTKETGKGSGLGLAMVYGFVKQSGGHVKIYSEPGMGTTVKLFLPQIANPADLAAAPVDAPAPQPTGRETILVVEDEEDVRHLVCNLLSALGYRILAASCGKAALTILDAEPDVDMLFTDVVLPGGMNGPEIARQAQLRRIGLKVLYTSGYTGNAIQQLEAMGSEIRLISKPYAIEDLAQTVRDTLDA